MNYIAEINAFYDWLETNPISYQAINLWHALMATANKAGWTSRFQVAISTLELKTGLTNRKAVERARNELAQRGRITWRSRPGNQSAEYSIISLCDKYTPSFVAQPVAQPVAINKLNETKHHHQKEAASPDADDASGGRGDLIPETDRAYNPYVKPVEDLAQEAIADATYFIPNVARICEISPPDLPAFTEALPGRMEIFVKHMKGRGTHTHTAAAFRKHFENWLRKRLKTMHHERKQQPTAEKDLRMAAAKYR